MNSSLDAKASISVVVPVYKCTDCIEILCARLSASIRTITDKFEIILVDDGGADGSWEKIIEVKQLNPSVSGIKLSRNYGQQLAITAGLHAAKGDYVVVLDCDLQDPPELIPRMYEEIQNGYDYVLAARVQRNHSLFRVLAARFYFFLLSKLTRQPIDPRHGSFSILSRKVVDAFNQFKERNRHFLFVLRWTGFRAGSVDYAHEGRLAGKSSYTLASLLRHAVDGLIFQTTVFLKWIIFLGMIFSALGIGFSIFLIARYFVHGAAEGWTSLATLILVCTGLIITSLGVVGLYVGKIFEQSKQRPLYILDVICERDKKW